MELKNEKFTLFKNEKKSKPESPDFTGNGMFDNMEFRISGWVRKSKDGLMYISGSIQHPRESSQPATAQDVDNFMGPLLDGTPAPETPKVVNEPINDLPF